MRICLLTTQNLDADPFPDNDRSKDQPHCSKRVHQPKTKRNCDYLRVVRIDDQRDHSDRCAHRAPRKYASDDTGDSDNPSESFKDPSDDSQYKMAAFKSGNFFSST